MSNQFTRPEGTGGKSILGSDNKNPPNDLEKNAIKRLRKEPDEAEQQEEKVF